ncbi:Na+/H+ antiporter NhaC family protein [Paraclostridium ghonii]|uniref:Na+/H+ antiporter NhaC family protein n=1 Tax=Paraclostridium ghonii TaxID=29358 RepID=UPI00202CFE42|nr:Na+/H+ antiporter NhaC family protein [Paeniclostridium ghonii]MCM0165856.1 Na+/H+ antiporter NhaC family protein [Paeniclostridium ghonii]
MENISNNKSNQKKGSAIALLPIGVFLVLFLGSGIITGDFYKMPALTAFIIAAVVAFIINPKESLDNKMDIFCKNAGDSNIVIMVVIFLLAGAFGSVAKAMGGVDSTVNLSLAILPPSFLVPGLFLVVCFISTSMGTSVGTVSALTPIAIGLSQKTGIELELLVAIIVGGAMVGDSLSIISDTTIAAASTQGCQMKDKVKMNFFVILPAALLSFIIISVMTAGTAASAQAGPYEIIKVVPYVAVLVGALAGANVFVILAGGVVFAGGIGIFTGTLNMWQFIEAVSKGMAGMQELCILVLVVGGVVGLIKHNGGIDFILNFVTSKIKSPIGAKFGIALIASIIDLCTANNTITIITAGPLAKDIGVKYKLDPRKIASILDLFSSCWQGMIPYGAQILTAVGIAGVSSIGVIRYLYYPIFLLIFASISLVIDFPALSFKKEDKKKAEQVKA